MPKILQKPCVFNVKKHKGHRNFRPKATLWEHMLLISKRLFCKLLHQISDRWVLWLVAA